MVVFIEDCLALIANKYIRNRGIRAEFGSAIL
jgi:hypothetical protein